MQVFFVSPNGRRKKGPVFIPSQKPQRVLDDTDWDKEQTVAEFRKFIEENDTEGQRAAISALNRFDC